VIAAVDQGDVNIGTPERFDGAKPTKTSADDDDAVSRTAGHFAYLAIRSTA
jgi:hypothetical protein